MTRRRHRARVGEPVACMEPDDFVRWAEVNALVSRPAARPCDDCPLAFALEMRAIDRCNGVPRGVEIDSDEDPDAPSFDVRVVGEIRTDEVERELLGTGRAYAAYRPDRRRTA
jgi:hypothetical protein